MRQERDERGRLLREWDDAGRLVYLARSNAGLEAEAEYGRPTRAVSRRATASHQGGDGASGQYRPRAVAWAGDS